MSTPMLWREEDAEAFRGTLVIAAERLGVQPLAVEKDYWVCQALRAMSSTHPGELVFKGGTSLEKLRIVRRFSEDLDLLFVGTRESNRGARAALRNLLQIAASATGSAPTVGTGGGTPGSFHREGYLTPTMRHRGAPGAIADPAAILVELAQAGTHGWPRIGRQFYDIWALLRTPEVRSLLQDAPLVAEILTSARAVSERLGRPDAPTPPGGFAASPALAPDGELADRLRREHDAAMRDLYYGTEPPPTFDDVLEQVHTDALLLRA